MNLENDPEFLQLRKDFIASFPSRRKKFETIQASWKKKDLTPVARLKLLKEGQVEVHRILGTAESYGLEGCTELLAPLDQILQAYIEKSFLDFDLDIWLSLPNDVLAAIENKKNLGGFKNSELFKKLSLIYNKL